MSIFTIKEGSNRPWYVAVLREPERDEFGAVINPDKPTMIPINFVTNGIKEVFLIWRAKSAKDPTATLFNVKMELTGTKEAGQVRYKPKTTDTNEKPGEYNVEFKLVFENGEVDFIPEDNFSTAIVNENLV